jgi:hypothetical protein
MTTLLCRGCHNDGIQDAILYARVISSEILPPAASAAVTRSVT